MSYYNYMNNKNHFIGPLPLDTPPQQVPDPFEAQRKKAEVESHVMAELYRLSDYEAEYSGDEWFDKHDKNDLTVINGILFDKKEKSIVRIPSFWKGSYAIPEGIKKIGPMAFSKTEVSEIIIPDTVEEIGEYAFYLMNHYYTLRINKETSRLQKIGDYAFSYENGMTKREWGEQPFSFTIPPMVREIGINPFKGAFIDRIDVSRDNPYYTSIDGVLFSGDLTRLIAYPRSKSDSKYTVPNTTRHIAEHAFELCGGLYEVVLPEELQSIGPEAFSECGDLMNINIPSSLKTIEKRVFQLTNLQVVDMPETIDYIDALAFSGLYHPHTVIIRGSRTKIAYDAISSYGGFSLLKVMPDSPAEEVAKKMDIRYKYINETDSFAWLKT